MALARVSSQSVSQFLDAFHPAINENQLHSGSHLSISFINLSDEQQLYSNPEFSSQFLKTIFAINAYEESRNLKFQKWFLSEHEEYDLRIFIGNMTRLHSLHSNGL